MLHQVNDTPGEITNSQRGLALCSLAEGEPEQTGLGPVLALSLLPFKKFNVPSVKAQVSGDPLKKNAQC